MVKNATHLGGSASDVIVGRVSHGMMTMKLANPPIPEDECFAAIRAGVDALPAGAKMFLNNGEFYSSTWGTENLEMLGRFYAQYPEYVDRTFLSVKGAVRTRGVPDSSPENLRRSVENIQRALGPHKKMDLFEPARVDSNFPIEDTMRNLVALKDEGFFTHIGLSECSADTLRRAHAVYPVTAAEIEISVWSYEEETKKVIATAAELGITVLGYSPLGRGFLTGTISSGKDLPETDWRRHLARFQDDSIAHNKRIVDALSAIAAKKGVAVGQLAIAWVAALGPHVIPLPGSSRAARTLENLAAGDIELSAEEFAEITAIAEKADVKGARYAADTQHLWG